MRTFSWPRFWDQALYSSGDLQTWPPSSARVFLKLCGLKYGRPTCPYPAATCHNALGAILAIEAARTPPWGQSLEGMSASSSWDLSKGAPNRLAYQLEVVSNLHQVRIVTNQEAAVVL